MDTSDSRLDHRFRDLYAGLGVKRIPTYCQIRKNTLTDWEDAISHIDKFWEPKEFDTGPLMDAFPHDVCHS